MKNACVQSRAAARLRSGGRDEAAHERLLQRMHSFFHLCVAYGGGSGGAYEFRIECEVVRRKLRTHLQRAEVHAPTRTLW